MPYTKKKPKSVQQKEKEDALSRSSVELCQNCNGTLSYLQRANDSSRTKTDVIDSTILDALRGNNKCLAAALDESKQDYRNLQAKYVNLQEERQYLLEKVSNLEFQVSQSKQKLSVCTQVCDLLEAAVESITCAKTHLKGGFDATSADCAVIPDVRFQADETSSFPESTAHLKNLFYPENGFTVSPTHKAKVYPRTPYLKHFAIHLPSSSTPLSDCTKETSFYDLFSREYKSPRDERRLGIEKEAENCCTVSRPQRKCASVNISYQEPDLKRKLQSTVTPRKTQRKPKVRL